MKKFFLLSAALLAVSGAFAQDFDVYVIGSNVNGQSWTCGAEDAKMTFVGEGVYEWDGEFLGTGFKFNDGTWSDDTHNWGAGEKLTLGEPYELYCSGGSGNIAFDGFTGVNKPHVVFNLNDGTCIVTGEATGVIEWFVTGDFNNWALDETSVLTNTGGKEYVKLGVNFEVTGKLKIASTGWADQWGTNDENVMLGFDTDEATLETVGGEGGGIVYFYIGEYDCFWNGETHVVRFAEAGSGVKSFEAVDGAAKYFNLQGVEVSEPANGLFIKVANGKAVKVAIR